MPDNNYKYLECFVILGTHSELHRGQMSHIRDISALRVKQVMSFECVVKNPHPSTQHYTSQLVTHTCTYKKTVSDLQ